MKPDYQQTTKELITNSVIPKDEVFYYDGVPLEPVFDLYFTFCQTNLNIASKHFGITPARIFIRNNTSINAFASHRNNYFLIGVHSGSLVGMYYFFDNKHELFETGSLSFLQRLNRELTETHDAPLTYLMQQVCNQFTYYHELAHLIQRSPLLSSSIEEKYFSAGDTYSQQKHVYEFDADLYGAEYIAFHLIEFWKKFTTGMRTGETLAQLISIGASSVLCYFLQLMQDYKSLYYSEYSHPHPLVRILYIIDCFVQTVEGNLPADIKIETIKVIQDAFKIADEIFIQEGSDIVSQFVQIFWKERTSIKTFVDESIISLVPTMPELVYNRVRGGDNLF